MKAKLSHKERQLQAMAGQVKERGGTPVFVPDPKGKGKSKGKKPRSNSPSKGKDSDSSSSPSGKSSGKKAKAKAKAKSAGKDAKNVEDVTCYNCGAKGHYANKCTHPKKQRGNPGSQSRDSSPSSSPLGSPRSSSNGSTNGAGSGPVDKVCHFHKPWRNAEQGGPKTCTSGKDCRFIHARNEKEYSIGILFPRALSPLIECFI